MKIEKIIMIVVVIGVLVFSVLGTAHFLLNTDDFNIPMKHNTTSFDQEDDERISFLLQDDKGSEHIVLLNESFTDWFDQDNPLDDWNSLTPGTFWTQGPIYGEPSHSPPHHAYTFAMTASMITPDLLFGEESSFSFWYAAELSSTPQNLELYLDDTGDAFTFWDATDPDSWPDPIWSDYGFSHEADDALPDNGYHYVELSLGEEYAGKTINFMFYHPGPTDWAGGMMVDTVMCTTKYTPTPPTADFTWIPIDPTTADVISFTDKSTDGDGTIESWEWDFGDGNTSTLQHPTHQYDIADTYMVCLTVTDDDGASDTICKSINVKDDEILPLYTVNKTVWDEENEQWVNHTTVNEGDNVRFKVEIINTYEDYFITFSGVIYDQFPCHLTYDNETGVEGIVFENHEDAGEEIDWDNKIVYWNRPFPISPGGNLVFYYNATANCDCSITNGSNIVTVSPALLKSKSGNGSIYNNQHPDWHDHPDWWSYTNASLNVSDSATVEVICIEEIELSVTKQVSIGCEDDFSGDGVVIGVDDPQWVTFKIVVSGNGSFDSVSVVDDLPYGLISDSDLVWDLESQEGVWSETITFSADVVDDFCGKVTNWVNVTGLYNGEEELVVSDTAWVNIECPIVEEPELSVIKSVKVDSTGPYSEAGVNIRLDDPQWVTFKIVVSGNGSFDSVSVEDDLPYGLISDSDLVWDLESQEGVWSETITFRADVLKDFCGKVTNWVNVTGLYNGEEELVVSDTAWVDIECEEPTGIITVDKWVKPNCDDELYGKHISFDYGEYDYVTYRLNISINESFSKPILGLSINDSLPQLEGLLFSESFVRRIVNGVQYPFDDYIKIVTDEYIYWNFTEAVLPGSLFSIYYQASVIACGEFENQVNASAYYEVSDPWCIENLYAEDSAIVEVICAPGIKITKEASLNGMDWTSEGVESGMDSIIWFRLLVENTGSEVLEGVNVYDYLPSFLIFKEMIDDGGANFIDIVCKDQLYDIRWFFTEVAIGETVEILFTTTVIGIGSGKNTATVTSCDGPSDSDSVTVSVGEGLFVEKLVSKDKETWLKNVTVSTGDTVSWSINISFYSTNSSHILHHINVWDTIPNGVNLVEGSSKLMRWDGTETNIADPAESNNLLHWELNEEFLLSGQWIILIFETTVEGTAVGELINTVNVTAKVCDSTYYEKQDTAKIFVSLHPLIECEKQVRKSTIDPWRDSIDALEGDTVSFRISVTNIYSMPMYSIKVWDTLPSNMNYVSGSATVLFNGTTYGDCEPDTISNNNLIWNNLCLYIPAPEGQIAQYLFPGETIHLQFDAKIIGTGVAINNVMINATVCYQGLSADCSDIATVNVDVDPLVANAGTTYTGFIDDEIQFSGSATGGTPPYSYYWDLDNDGNFDDSTEKNPTKTWTIAGTYTIRLKVVDNASRNATDSAMVIIKERTPDLFTSGPIVLSDVRRRSTQTATFTVENRGDPGSTLDWSIQSHPDWGEWEFIPREGTGLTPEDGKLTIEVTIEIPNRRNSEFDGEIIVINEDDPTDTAQIPVSVTTSRPFNPFTVFIERMINRFPFLEWVLQRFL